MNNNSNFYLKIDGEKLKTALEKVEDAFEYIKDAKSDISNLDLVSYVNDNRDEIKDIKDAIYNFSMAYNESNMSTLNVLSNQIEDFSDGSRNLEITDYDGEETLLINTGMIDSTLAAMILAEYSFLNVEDRELVEAIAYGNQGSTSSQIIEGDITFDIKSGRILCGDKEVSSFQDVVDYINESGDVLTSNYVNLLYDMDYDLCSYQYFIDDLKRQYELSGDNFTSVQLADAFVNTGLIFDPMATGELNVLVEGKPTLFQADRTENELTVQNQYCLINTNNTDIQTAEALAMMYLFLEEPELAEQVIYDPTNSHPVQTTYSINLNTDNISSDVALHLYEANFSRDSMGTLENYDYITSEKFYLKADVNTIYDGLFNTKTSGAFSVDLYQIKRDEPQTYELLLKSPNELTAEEIEILDNSKYCIGLNYGVDPNSCNFPALLNFGDAAEIKQKWQPIYDNEKILEETVENTDWHALRAIRDVLEAGTYQVFDVKYDENDNIVEVSVDPNGQRWVKVDENINAVFESITGDDGSIGTYTIDSGSTNVYGGEDDNFIGVLYSLSSGVWVDSRTKSKVTKEQANEVISLIYNGDYETANEILANFNSNIQGPHFDKNCLEFFNELGYTFDKFEEYRKLENCNVEKKDLSYCAKVFGSSTAQVGLYLTGGVVGFFENIFDGLYGTVGTLAYHLVDVTEGADIESIQNVYDDVKKNVDKLYNEGYFYGEHTIEETMYAIFGQSFSDDFYIALNKFDPKKVVETEEFTSVLTDKYSSLTTIFNEELGGVDHHEERLDSFITDKILTDSLTYENASAIYYMIPGDVPDISYSQDNYGNIVLSEESKRFITEHISEIEYNDENLLSLAVGEALKGYKISENDSEAMTFEEFVSSEAYNETYDLLSDKYLETLGANYVGDEDFAYSDANSNEVRYTERLYFVMALDIMNGSRKSNWIRQSIQGSSTLVTDQMSVIAEYGKGDLAKLRAIDNHVKNVVGYDVSYNISHLFGSELGQFIDEYGAFDGTIVENVVTSVGEMIPLIVISAVSGGTATVGTTMLETGLIFSSAYGKTFESTYQDPRFNEGDMYNRFFYSLITGAIEAAIERIGIGGSRLAGLEATDFLKNLTRGLFKNNKTAWVKTALKALEAMSYEGVEEVLSGLMEPFSAAIAIYHSGEKIPDELASYITEGQFIEDYFAGFLSSVIINSGSYSISMATESVGNGTFRAEMMDKYDPSTGLSYLEWQQCVISAEDFYRKYMAGDEAAIIIIDVLKSEQDTLSKMVKGSKAIENEIVDALRVSDLLNFEGIYSNLSADAKNAVDLKSFFKMIMLKGDLGIPKNNPVSGLITYENLTSRERDALNQFFGESIKTMRKDGGVSAYKAFKNGIEVTLDDGSKTTLDIASMFRTSGNWLSLCNHFINLSTVQSIELNSVQTTEIMDSIESVKPEELESSYEKLNPKTREKITYSTYVSLYLALSTASYELLSVFTSDSSKAFGIKPGKANNDLIDSINDALEDIDTSESIDSLDSDAPTSVWSIAVDDIVTPDYDQIERSILEGIRISSNMPIEFRVDGAQFDEIFIVDEYGKAIPRPDKADLGNAFYQQLFDYAKANDLIDSVRFAINGYEIDFSKYISDSAIDGEVVSDDSGVTSSEELNDEPDNPTTETSDISQDSDAVVEQQVDVETTNPTTEISDISQDSDAVVEQQVDVEINNPTTETSDISQDSDAVVEQQVDVETDNPTTETSDISQDSDAVVEQQADVEINANQELISVQDNISDNNSNSVITNLLSSIPGLKTIMASSAFVSDLVTGGVKTLLVFGNLMLITRNFDISTAGSIIYGAFKAGKYIIKKIFGGVTKIGAKTKNSIISKISNINIFQKISDAIKNNSVYEWLKSKSIIKDGLLGLAKTLGVYAICSFGLNMLFPNITLSFNGTSVLTIASRVVAGGYAATGIFGYSISKVSSLIANSLAKIKTKNELISKSLKSKTFTKIIGTVVKYSAILLGAYVAINNLVIPSLKFSNVISMVGLTTSKVSIIAASAITGIHLAGKIIKITIKGIGKLAKIPFDKAKTTGKVSKLNVKSNGWLGNVVNCAGVPLLTYGILSTITPLSVIESALLSSEIAAYNIFKVLKNAKGVKNIVSSDVIENSVVDNLNPEGIAEISDNAMSDVADNPNVDNSVAEDGVEISDEVVSDDVDTPIVDDNNEVDKSLDDIIDERDNSKDPDKKEKTPKILVPIIKFPTFVKKVFVNNHSSKWLKLALIVLGLLATLFAISNINFDWNDDETKHPDFYIRLKGSNNIELYINNVYQELGYYAYDSLDGDITDKVIVTGEVNYEKIGIYVLTYTVTNTREKTLSTTRIINVVEKKPIIINDNNISIEESTDDWDNDNNPITPSIPLTITEIELNDFNEQIEKGKVHDGINQKTSVLVNQYINKFMFQKSIVYGISLTSIVKDNGIYSDIYACNNDYLNNEASSLIVTNGTLERIYNNENSCFNNYGVFYFTKNKLNHAVVNSETISQQIIDSKTRNTFVYRAILVDNGNAINNTDTLTKNTAICQSDNNKLKLYSYDNEVSYRELSEKMVSDGCQTGILLTEGDTIIYKSQYSSTLNVQRGSDIENDSIMIFYRK